MARDVIHSDQAPKAIGPYSQAIRVDAGKMVFCSGQIPLDPATGELVKGDIVEQTQRVMENLRAVLAASGAGFEHVVRCNIFLADLNDFAKVNETYGRYFTANPPSRATVQVARLPRDSRVEIDCIAVI
ncbi:RidA family protein [Vulgatibacter incomptus]|uniref:Endoribonuclease L-PSP n=1 Tax=Vulgatibacter incomptus TaxID=1391653 RepID=A0A0K1PBD1_9BACT|nr:RidA family protein [Vulgatibacter incomptus]AKU90706.1 Endoribonuclease L-PSP [Vulgatibacter incomptus]